MIYMDKKQIELLEKLEHGMVYQFHVGCGLDDEIRYLIDKKLCTARVDIADDLYMLTQDGIHLLASEKENAQKVAEEIANKKAEKNTEFRFQLFNSILGAVVGSMATLFVEHFFEIIHFINSILQS